MQTDPLTLIKSGDHVQIFAGKHDPDTGEPRKIMVIWRDNDVLWWGPIIQTVLNDPRVVVLEGEIRITMELLRDFHTEVWNPEEQEC